MRDKTMVFLISFWRSRSTVCMSMRINGSRAEKASSMRSTGGVVGESARKTDTLLHAAGQLVRIFFLETF